MSKDLSVLAFQPAAEDVEKNIDPFILRFKALINRHGFCFPTKNNVSNNVIVKLNKTPDRLSDNEWRSTGYPFLEIDREVLIKLSQGQVDFSKNETEALEAVCGDFFNLDGYPRNSRGAPDLRAVRL